MPAALPNLHVTTLTQFTPPPLGVFYRRSTPQTKAMIDGVLAKEDDNDGTHLEQEYGALEARPLLGSAPIDLRWRVSFSSGLTDPTSLSFSPVTTATARPSARAAGATTCALDSHRFFGRCSWQAHAGTDVKARGSVEAHPALCVLRAAQSFQTDPTTENTAIGNHAINYN